MLTRRTPYILLALTGLLASACSEGGSQTRVDEETHRLRRTEGGYYVELPGGVDSIEGPGSGAAGDDPMSWPEEPCTEERDGMDADGDGTLGCGEVLPDCGFTDECALLQVREIHTVLIDADGNLLSETFEFCTQCFGADGTATGPEACTSEPLLPPETECWEEWKDDGTTCYVCAGPGGVVTDDGCSPPPPADDCWGGFCDARPECCAMTFSGEAAWDETCDRDLIAWCEPYPIEPPVDDCYTRLLEVDPTCETGWSDACDALFVELCAYPEPPPGDDCLALLIEAEPSCELEWSEICEARLADFCGIPPVEPCPPDGGGAGGGEGGDEEDGTM